MNLARYTTIHMRKGGKTNKPAWNSNPIFVDCPVCGNKFRTILAKIKVGKGKFCSKECYLKDHGKNTWTNGICLGCGKEFNYIAHRKQVCCSLSCNTAWKKIKNKDKKYTEIECPQCGCKRNVLNSRLAVGRGKFCSKECYYHWMEKNRLGENAPAWKGGITPLYKAVRLSGKYRNWRNVVFKKDNYTCQMCGQIGGSLIVDHIKGLAMIIKNNNIRNTLEASQCEELWEIDNGRVLCYSCHTKTPNYGYHGRV